MGVRIRVNDDADFAKEVREAIKKNGGHCCCQVLKTDDTKCMCKMFRDQIANGEYGECDCGLYIAEEIKDKGVAL